MARYSFTLTSGKEIVVSARNKRVSTSTFLNRLEHYAYTILIEINGNKYQTTFHDCNYNYLQNKGADKNMLCTALDCVMTDGDSYDYNRNLEDFAYEYGYEEDMKKAEKAFNACKKAYEFFKANLTSDEYEEISKTYIR